jgi:hypothetical protein
MNSNNFNETYLSNSVGCDTIVITKQGPLKISEIKVGDLVKTHLNTFEKVTHFFKNKPDDTQFYSLETTSVSATNLVWSKKSASEEPCWSTLRELWFGNHLVTGKTLKNTYDFVDANIYLNEDFNEYVYNIGVENSHSYCTQFIVLRDCFFPEFNY